MQTEKSLPIALAALRLSVFLVMLAACFALYRLRDRDTMLTVTK